MGGLRRNEEKQNEREGKKGATARLVIRGVIQHIRLISMHELWLHGGEGGLFPTGEMPTCPKAVATWRCARRGREAKAFWRAG